MYLTAYTYVSISHAFKGEISKKEEHERDGGEESVTAAGDSIFFLFLFPTHHPTHPAHIKREPGYVAEREVGREREREREEGGGERVRSVPLFQQSIPRRRRRHRSVFTAEANKSVVRRWKRRRPRLEGVREAAPPRRKEGRSGNWSLADNEEGEEGGDRRGSVRPFVRVSGSPLALSFHYILFFSG